MENRETARFPVGDHDGAASARLTVAADYADIRHLFQNAHDKHGSSGPDDWQWEANCPAAPHRATGNANKVVGRYDATDGRHVLSCIAGCSVADLAAAVGLSSAEVKYPLFAAELARAFALPADHLRSWGFSDVTLPVKGVAIEHRTRSGGSVTQYRLRLKDAPTGKNRFSRRFYIPAGTSLPAFGADRLGDADSAIFVEGSSDVVTLAFCGYAAVGVAGQTQAKAITSDVVRNLRTIHVFREPDAVFVGQVHRRLRELSWPGQLFVIEAESIHAKDPAALWQRLRAEYGTDDVARAAYRAVFDKAVEAAAPPSDETLSEAGEYRNAGLVDDLNRELAVLREPAGLLLYERGGRTYQLKKLHELSPLYANRAPDYNGDVLKWWLSQARRREFDRVVFAPGRETPGCYNLWRGFAVEPRAGAIPCFWEHVRDVICAGDVAKFDYVRRWLALMVQRPFELPETALILRSREGTGKNLFVEFVAAMFRPENYVVADKTEQVVGHFNKEMGEAVLVFGNESFWGGDRKNQGALKAMISDRSYRVEAKGKDAFYVDNCKHVIFASNSDHPVPVDKGDRRFVLLDVSEHRRGDHGYFSALVEEQRSDGAAVLLAELLAVDLADFNPRNRPESTLAAELQIRSGSPLDQWLNDCLFEGEIQWEGRVEAADSDGRAYSYMSQQRIPWAGEILKDRLYESYEGHCRKMRQRPESRSLFFRELHDARKYEVMRDGPRRNVDGTRTRMMALLPLVEARRNFGRRMGLPDAFWDDAVDPGDVETEPQSERPRQGAEESEF